MSDDDQGALLDTPESTDEPESSDAPTDAPSTTLRRRRRAANITRPFPRRSLPDAVQVPTAIKDKNGGQPWTPDQVASAVGMSPKSTSFFNLTSAAREFGLTEGTRDAAVISITELGHRAVYPTSDEEGSRALLEAFFSVDLFKRVVDHYQGSALPEEPYRTNTLTTTFNLDGSIVDEFVEVFQKSARFVGVGAEWNGTPAGKGGGTVPQATSVRVGAPKKKDDTGLRCFIAMPFGERDPKHPAGFFSEVQKSLLIPAITDAGFEAFTASREGSDVIQATIVNDLLQADLVVVDLTEHNPNVLFELGMRMHAEKPVALVRAKGTGPIFDVDNMLRVAEYSPNLWKSTVESDRVVLSAHIKAAWENNDPSKSFMQILKRPEVVA